MSLKLDMSKAYECVEWSYLEKVMTMLGFHPTFDSLIMACVTTATFSVLINGYPRGHIVPTRGLCQEDLLSSYIFLLCTEGLISTLQGGDRANRLQVLKICRGAPEINHLLFANDCVLFCKADSATNS